MSAIMFSHEFASVSVCQSVCQSAVCGRIICFAAVPMGNWHNWLSRWARRWNIKVNPIQLPEQMPLPVLSKVCIAIKFYILPSAPTQAAVALNSIRENRFGSSAFSMYCAVLLNVSVQVLRKDYKSCVRSALVSQFS